MIRRFLVAATLYFGALATGVAQPVGLQCTITKDFSGTDAVGDVVYFGFDTATGKVFTVGAVTKMFGSAMHAREDYPGASITEDEILMPSSAGSFVIQRKTGRFLQFYGQHRDVLLGVGDCVKIEEKPNKF